MKTFIKIAIFPLFLSSLAMCGQAQSSASKTSNVDAKEFHHLMDSLEHEQILDVRTPGEWKSGIIPGAIRINWYDSDFKAQVKKLEKNKAVLIYCASGRRSNEAMQELSKMGFSEVYNLDGGINAWKRSNYEMDK